MSVARASALSVNEAAVVVDSADARRYAKVPHLWALGVGAVISGDFFGWQAALIAGYDGLLILLAVMTVLYVVLSFSIAELSAMIPHGGGPYVFALHGINSTSGYFAGLAECLKVVVTAAVANSGISSYLCELIGMSTDFGPMWWAIFFVLFVGLNVMGVEMTFRVQAFCTVLSVLVLVVFFIGAATVMSYDEWVVQHDWEYKGWDGALQGASFTLWFYLGIEELPLAIEETVEPSKNMPRGLILSIITLVVLAFCTVIFSAISPGADGFYATSSPLLMGYQSVFGDTSTTSGFTWILIVGLISSFHSFLFCMGKLLFAIARDGYLPAVLTKVHPTRGTTWASLTIGASIAFVIAVILHFAIGDTRLGSVLINLALIGAIVSYIFQLVAFIMLRFREPDRERPYRSPFGVPGAVIAILICLFALVGIIYSGTSSTDFLASVIVAIVYFILGAVYFVMVVKPRLAAGETAHAKDMRENLLSSRTSGKV